MIQFTRNFPPELASVVQPLLERYLFIVPPYCRSLWVDYRADSEHKIASVRTCSEYGFAKIWIGPDWLSLNDQEREDTLIHELVHVIFGPMREFILSFINAHLAEDNPLHEFVHDQFRYQEETIVQALGEAVYKVRHERK